MPLRLRGHRYVTVPVAVTIGWQETCVVPLAHDCNSPRTGPDVLNVPDVLLPDGESGIPRIGRFVARLVAAYFDIVELSMLRDEPKERVREGARHK